MPVSVASISDSGMLSAMPARQPPQPPGTSPQVRVLSATMVSIDQSWHHRLSSPFWRLYRNDADGAAIIHPAGITALPACRAVLVPPWGDFRASCRGRIGHLYVHFTAIGLPEPWCRKWFARPLVLAASPWRDALLASLAHGDRRGPVASTRLQAVVADAIAEALSCLAGRAIDELPGVQDDDQLPRVLHHIEECLQRRLPVGELAHLVGMDPDAFSRRFRLRHGVPPARYVLERRIAVASDRLRLTAESIDSVAADCGFANRFHFTRAFTRIMGRAPAAWRADQQAG